MKPPAATTTPGRRGVISANWLAYADSVGSADILAGATACAEDLAGLGVAGVELPIAHLDRELMGLPEDFWHTLREKFAACGILVESVHGPVFSYDRFDLAEESERMTRYALAAKTLGAQALVVHPVLHANLHVCPIAARAMDRDVHLATAITQELEGSSCALAVENVPHNSWAYLRELFRRLPAAAGLCFDTGHYQVRPEIPLAAALTEFGQRIVCWHLNDNHGLCDEHLPPGGGVFDWSAWRSAAATSNAPQVIELSLPARWEKPEARDLSLAAYAAALLAVERTCGPAAHHA